MSTDPEYTSGSYFDRLQVQLELNVLSQFSGIMGNSSQNATQGVSPSISAVDTGIKAAMALSGALASGIESAYLPALEALGLSGMACLPISKQLDPVVGVDCHIMIPGGPLPNPYIGLLLNPKDFIAVAIASILPPPPPMPEEGASEGEGDEAKLLEMAHMAATMAIGMLGATVKLGNFLPRAVAGTPTRNVFHFPIGGAFVAPPMNKGHAFMGSLNVLADDDPLSGGGAHLHMDCWDIGIPTPHLNKKSAEYAALFLPTGVIIPIPWVKPILTNPIPTPINPVAALKKLLMGAFARFYKKRTKKAERLKQGDVNPAIRTSSLAVTKSGSSKRKRGKRGWKKQTQRPNGKVIVLQPGAKGNRNKALNGKLQPNAKYRVGNKTYETDAQGRVCRVSGKLELGKIGRNKYQQQKAVKLKGGIKGKDQGGHLIAHRFKGAGEQINYVPMDGTLNNGAWEQMENSWAKALKSVPPKAVEVEIRPIYKGNSARPHKIQVRYRIDNKSYVEIFPN